MKTTITLILLSVCHLLAQGQDYKFSMKTGTLSFSEVNNLTINGNSGSEVTMSAKDSKSMPERAQGLKPISGTGKMDNTGLGFAVEDSENGKSVFQVTRNAGRIIVSVPNTVKIHITHSGNQGGTIEINNFSGEIETDTRYSGLKFTNVTGPVLANTIYGKIEGSFGSLSNKDMSLVSVYGLVDVALPAATKSDLVLKSSYGDIFTDLDIEIEQEEGMKSIRSNNIKGKLNGGGNKLYLEAKYGNIYLRSK